MKERTTDPRIKRLAEEAAKGKAAELVADLVETSLKLGTDHASIAELKLMSRALREMRYAARVFSKYQGIRKVAVFGSARSKPDEEEYKLAKSFAQKIVSKDFMVITGGGDGIMGAAQEGAGAEKSFGLNIRLPFEQHPNATIHDDPKLLNFNYFFARKLTFAKETHAFALFPGGFGTHDEGCEILTLMQTGMLPKKPILLVGSGFWTRIMKAIAKAMLNRPDGIKFISPKDLELFKIIDEKDIPEALEDIGRSKEFFDKADRASSEAGEQATVPSTAPAAPRSESRTMEAKGSQELVRYKIFKILF